LGCGVFEADSASTVADHGSTYTFGVYNLAVLTPGRTTELAGYSAMAKAEDLGVYLNTRQ
jgi:hypothetical protein